MKMEIKKVGIVLYAMTLLLCLYLVFSSGIILYMERLGMKLIIFHPDLPFTAEYVSEFNILPQVLGFVYLILSGVFFAVIGYKELRKEG